MASDLPQADAEMGKLLGHQRGKIRYFRAVAICADRLAAFELDYSRDQKIPYHPSREPAKLRWLTWGVSGAPRPDRQNL